MDLQQLTGWIKSTALPKIVELLDLFAKDNWALRKERAKNAARSAYFNGGNTLTGATVLEIPQAQQSDQTFSYLLFVTDELSGKGRFRTDAIAPDVSVNPPVGLPIFNAGFEVIIRGHENIKGFRVMAESGATLRYTYELFQ